MPMPPMTPFDLPPREFARKLSAREILVFYSNINDLDPTLKYFLIKFGYARVNIIQVIVLTKV